MNIKFVNVDEHQMQRALRTALHFHKNYPDRPLGQYNLVGYVNPAEASNFAAWRTKTGIVVRQIRK